jgi:hypothetical protein
MNAEAKHLALWIIGGFLVQGLVLLILWLVARG